MKKTLPILLAVAAAPAVAEDSRQLDAHEHGVGALNIAIDGSAVAMEFTAPGADIVGFEYEASSDEDLAAIDQAIAALGAPLDLFVVNAEAGCTVTDATAELETEDDHDDHGDDHDDHDDDHGEEHAEGEDDHDEEHADDDHDHEEHAEEASHTEFHAAYAMICDNPDALSDITFAYFDAFPNALEVEVQVLTASGAQAFEVERDAPTLSLAGAL
ncbi:MAG: DUF2796 domain-containing protein [Pseudomonadota bacterium]